MATSTCTTPKLANNTEVILHARECRRQEIRAAALAATPRIIALKSKPKDRAAAILAVLIEEFEKAMV